MNTHALPCFTNAFARTYPLLLPPRYCSPSLPHRAEENRERLLRVSSVLRFEFPYPLPCCSPNCRTGREKNGGFRVLRPNPGSPPTPPTHLLLQPELPDWEEEEQLRRSLAVVEAERIQLGREYEAMAQAVLALARVGECLAQAVLALARVVRWWGSGRVSSCAGGWAG